jgi:hypothetical protein
MEREIRVLWWRYQGKLKVVYSLLTKYLHLFCPPFVLKLDIGRDGGDIRDILRLYLVGIVVIQKKAGNRGIEVTV